MYVLELRYRMSEIESMGDGLDGVGSDALI